MKINKTKIAFVALCFFFSLHCYGQVDTVNVTIETIENMEVAFGRLELALQNLETLAPHINKNDTALYVAFLSTYAEALRWNGRFDNAIKAYFKIIKLAPNNKYLFRTSYYALAEIQELTGDFDNAIVSNKKLLTIDLEEYNFEQANQFEGPNYVYVENIAEIYLYQKKYKTLNAWCKKYNYLFAEQLAYFRCCYFYDTKQLDSALHYANIYAMAMPNENYNFYYLRANICLMRKLHCENNSYKTALEVIKEQNNLIESKQQKIPAAYFNCWYYKNREIEIEKVLADKNKFMEE